jgi:hypothetical protein
MMPSVHVVAGVTLIAAGALLGSFTVFVLWPRLREGAAATIAALCGALIAAGGLLVQEDVGPGSWVTAIAICAVLAPAHARFVFGRPGLAR